MCNIHSKTNLKTVTVYKAVKKIDEDFYGYFAGTKIEIGKVKRQTLKRIHPDLYCNNLYCMGDHHYNNHMMGKSSGFESHHDAKLLSSVVLKVVLGGVIWIGDASDIDLYIPDNHIVYAGSEILSFEET